MNDSGYAGTQDPYSGNSPFNAITFAARMVQSAGATTMLVQVQAVTNTGGVSPVGFVDVQPMVNQVDGAGNATPHGTIYHTPYMRLQGGANAVIIDPQVGDIGLACFASHDISSVKATRKVSNPGSRRRFSWADGLYIGGVLNGIPAQYLQFNADGVTVTSAQGIALNAPTAIVATTPVVAVSDNLTVGTGATGSFTTPTGQIVTVADGIITNIF